MVFFIVFRYVFASQGVGFLEPREEGAGPRSRNVGFMSSGFDLVAGALTRLCFCTLLLRSVTCSARCMQHRSLDRSVGPCNSASFHVIEVEKASEDASY